MKTRERGHDLGVRDALVIVLTIVTLAGALGMQMAAGSRVVEATVGGAILEAWSEVGRRSIEVIERTAPRAEVERSLPERRAVREAGTRSRS